jgi:hypothetical protein
MLLCCFSGSQRLSVGEPQNRFFCNLATHILLQFFAIVKQILETQKLVSETQKWFATSNTVLVLMFYVDAVLYQCFSTEFFSL